MDFFANAFITRDVPTQDDNEESDVVTKDGIQIREKVMAHPPGVDIVKCEVCGVVNAKYKCPGCFCQTCSLKCSKQHKLDTTCSGVRSRTHFVERKQYSEQDMMSDYNFLEEVGRTVDNAARDNIKLDHGNNPNRKRIFGAHGSVTHPQGHHNKNRHQNKNNNNTAPSPANDASMEAISLTAAQELERLGSVGSGSYKDKQLILQAKKRASHLIMMADGLRKRKENSTHWKDKPSRILWTLEWQFPELNSSSSDLSKRRRILTHKNEESKTLRNLLAEELVKEENADLAEHYLIDSLDQCRLFFVIPLRHANKPALYPLNSQDTIQEALKFKKVLEYPTIMVLGPQSASSSTSADTSGQPTKETESVGSGVETIANPDVGTTQGGGEYENKDDPILARYTIEAPPTHWPKKVVPAKDDTKRPNEDDEEEEQPKAKKAKTEKEREDDEDEESSSDDSSADDSSDESSEEFSDDDDDESDEDGEEVDTDVKNKDDDIEDSSETPGVTDEDQESQLKLGQAILEAFNQDFGQEGQ